MGSSAVEVGGMGCRGGAVLTPDPPPPLSGTPVVADNWEPTTLIETSHLMRSPRLPIPSKEDVTVGTNLWVRDVLLSEREQGETRTVLA